MTKMSSKGQVVIPASMRKKINEGDSIMVFQNEDQIILKKASSLDKNFEDDVAFAKRTDAAYQRYKKGEFASLHADEFLEKLSKC